MAISEAVEVAASDPNKVFFGKRSHHVLLHQTVIGEEAIKQFEKSKSISRHDNGCVGGGSNFGGFFFFCLRDPGREAGARRRCAL